MAIAQNMPIMLLVRNRFLDVRQWLA